MVEPYKQIYTVRAAAILLGVNASTVYEYINTGELDCIVIGSKKIRGEDLKRFVDSRQPINKRT